MAHNYVTNDARSSQSFLCLYYWLNYWLSLSDPRMAAVAGGLPQPLPLALPRANSHEHPDFEHPQTHECGNTQPKCVGVEDGSLVGAFSHFVAVHPFLLLTSYFLLLTSYYSLLTFYYSLHLAGSQISLRVRTHQCVRGGRTRPGLPRDHALTVRMANRSASLCPGVLLVPK
jgi:hypothetical protein